MEIFVNDKVVNINLVQNFLKIIDITLHKNNFYRKDFIFKKDFIYLYLKEIHIKVFI